MREISLQMIDRNIDSFWWKEELLEIQQAISYGKPTEDQKIQRTKAFTTK